jgi:hypothetical protein
MPRVSRSLEIRKGTPFKFALRNEFPGREGKLLRLAHTGHVVRVLHRWNDTELANLATFTDGLRKNGLSVPRYDALIAPRWDRAGRPALYLVTESIAGERLDEIAAPSKLDWDLPLSRQFYNAFYDTLDRFATRLLLHYLQIIKRGGLLFSAMDQSQFLYGVRRGERQPDIFFVDLDPTYRVLDSHADASVQSQAKSDFEKPINILFEMELLHPQAPLPVSKRTVRRYFNACTAVFNDFYSRNTPWWGRAPNFEQYQRMKTQMLGA